MIISNLKHCKTFLRLFRTSTQTTRNASSSQQNDRLPSYCHYIGKEPLAFRTVGQQLARAAKLYPNREAIVSCDQQRRYTFAEALEKADRLAAGFLKIGLNRGDRIGIWSPNTAEWYLYMMAATRAGLISVALNPAYQSREIAYCIKKVNLKAIITTETYRTQNYYNILSKIVPEIPLAVNCHVESKEFSSLKSVIIDTNSKLPGVITFDDLITLASNTEVAEIDGVQKFVQPDTACNIQFTSGTTGNPKAATMSHMSFVNNGIHIANRTELSQKAHRICVQVPLFHAFGIVIGIMTALAHGTTLVLPAPGYNPEASLRAIGKEKCTVIYGTPTMYVDLVARQRELNANLDTAEIATTGGAPCSPQLFLDIQRVLKVRTVKTVFGLTETTASSFFSLANESEYQVTQTVGHLQDHLEAKVIDKCGNTVPMGQPGELCLRGYSTMLGYYGDEAKTNEIISNDKWLKTGDQFVLEENGYGRIVGRLKDLIIRGGENIYPKEIEDFLNTHPDILECHVFGVPDARMGEVVCAAIRTTGKHLTRSDIKLFFEGQLSHFKVPQYVNVVERFPKTASGKVQKYKLRDEFIANNATPKIGI